MSERANVTAVDAIADFRADLIVYLSKARPALEEVSADVQRMRSWLEGEQRGHWESQLKRRKREWDEAQAALFSARISNLREESAAEVQAVHRSKRAYHEAEDKLRTVKRWSRDFDGRVLPLVKQIEKLHTLLANDLPKAVVHLGELLKILEGYSDIAPPGLGGGPQSSGNPPSPVSPATPASTNSNAP